MAENPHDEFLELYRPIHTQFARYCSNLAYGLMDADDLVQETVLITLQRFHTVREKQKLLGYMIAVSNNIVRNHLRRKKFSGEYNEKSLRRLESGLVSPETALDIHHLHLALQQLPARDRESILLFEINGFSIEEIAVIQESTAGATKTRLSRAREKLRQLLDDEPVQKEKKPARRFLPLIILPMNTSKVFDTLRNLPSDVPLDSVEKFVSTQVAGKVTLSAAGQVKMFLLKFHLNSILFTLLAAGAIATALVLSTGSENAKASPSSMLQTKTPVQAGMDLPVSIMDFNQSQNIVPALAVDSPAVVQKDTVHATAYSYSYSDSSGRKEVMTFSGNTKVKTTSTYVSATSKPGKTAKATSAYVYASNHSAVTMVSSDTGFAFRYAPARDSMSELVVPAMNFELQDMPGPQVFCDPNNHDTLQQVIERALLSDSLISDAHHYCFKINGSGLKVNGQKQSKETWRRYKKLIEENSPNKVSHTFSYALCVDGEDTTMQLENYQH